MTQRDLILGIDPGFAGFLALLHPPTRAIIDHLPMPVTGKGKRRQVHVEALAFWLQLYRRRIGVSVLEKALAFDKKDGRRQGIHSTARSWHGRGEVRSALVTLECGRLIEPEPGVWKIPMGLTSDKALSVRRATRFFPTVIFEGPRGGMLDGLAEACLLAVHGARAIGVWR